MANLQRPQKEGSVRTYQEKVGLGYLDILASEMDADLDTIYSAWNAGGAPAGPAGGDLTGVYPNPQVLKAAGAFAATGTITASNGQVLLAPQGQLASDASYTSLVRNAAITPGYDNTKVGWQFSLDGPSDRVFLARTAVGGAVTYPFQLNGPTGDMVATGRSVHRQYTGGIYGANTVANGQAKQMAVLNTAWWASSLNNMSQNRIDFDRPGIVLLWARFTFSPAATGFGVGITVEQWNGSSYLTAGSASTRTDSSISVVAIAPAWDANYQLTSVSVGNATGASISGNVFFAAQYLGTW